MESNQNTARRSTETTNTPIAVGDQVPDFELPGYRDGGVETFRLSEYTAEGPVVLVFYPFDFSPVCSKQLCTFRDAEWLTFTEDVTVWGVSSDSAYSHNAFSNKYDLQFPLLSDRLGAVADQFGLLLEEFNHHEAIPQRAIISIDSSRTVRYTWIADSQYQSPGHDIIESSIAWHQEGGDDG